MRDDDFLKQDGYDESIPTPTVAVDPATEQDPNPQPTGRTAGVFFGAFVDDRPPVDGGHAPGAVNENGEMLRADGTVAPPKGGE